MTTLPAVDDRRPVTSSRARKRSEGRRGGINQSDDKNMPTAAGGGMDQPPPPPSFCYCPLTMVVMKDPVQDREGEHMKPRGVEP